MSANANAGYRYLANELGLFAHATNWKTYWATQIAPFVKGDLLEVGSGIGSNTRFLKPLCRGRYLRLEPDAELVRQSQLDPQCSQVETCVGMVSALAAEECFDTAVYIDVLEHIDKDAAELAAVAQHIRPKGYVIVVSPAFQTLYSRFDQALGHYRRYNRASLLRCSPPVCSVARVAYLDSLGCLLCWANRVMLRQGCPVLKQVLFWDRWIVPISRVIDRVIRFRFGRSILVIWQVPD